MDKFTHYFIRPLPDLRHKMPKSPRLVYDLLAFSLILGIFILIAFGASTLSAPLSTIQKTEISLDPLKLPEYALRTTLRMFMAVAVSLVFSLLYATLAAKSKKAEQVMIPILDILQSVPILGYISFTVTAFMAMFPGSTLGLEMAAIFAIFTSQAWNMTFSLYQSLQNIPSDINEAARVFRLSGWQRFWRMELPYAIPGLVWNTMMSMSGGWFFVVASEAITVGKQNILLPGIGSYISLAITQMNMGAIGYAILAMVIVILLYDQLFFRPLVAWSDKFHYELSASQNIPHSWVLQLFRKSKMVKKLVMPIVWIAHFFLNLHLYRRHYSGGAVAVKTPCAATCKLLDIIWYGMLIACGVFAMNAVFHFFQDNITFSEVIHVFMLAMATLLRVIILIIIASLVWVPIGVYIGLRPKLAEQIQPLAQFLAAFPANLLFPIAVIIISRYQLSPNIWLSPLIILGTQWYILFNVIAGASAFPNDLQEVTRNFNVKGSIWWRKVILPGIFPYYLTGAITASGGAWNASIVSEAVSWGSTHLTATGLGAYIAQMTAAGDYTHITLGVGMMSVFVVLFNRFFWRRLYEVSARKLRFD